MRHGRRGEVTTFLFILVGLVAGAITGYSMSRAKSPFTAAAIFAVGFIALIGFIIWLFLGG